SSPPTTVVGDEPPGTVPTTVPATPAAAGDDEPASPAAAEAEGMTLALDPADDLVDGTVATVSLTGVQPGRWLVALTCATGTTEIFRYSDDPDDPGCDHGGGYSSTPVDAAGAAEIEVRL